MRPLRRAARAGATQIAARDVALDQLLKFLGDLIALECHGFGPVFIHWRHRTLTRARKTDADVGVLALTGTVDDAAHDRDRHVLDTDVVFAPFGHALANMPLNAIGQLLEVSAGGAPAARAGGYQRRKRAQPHGLEQLLRDDDLAPAISVRLRRERYANGVANALLQQNRH